MDIGHGRTYWFATKNAPQCEPDEPDGCKAELRRRFCGWHEPIAAVLEAADEAAILRNDVYYLDPLPHWSKGRERGYLPDGDRMSEGEVKPRFSEHRDHR